MELTIAFTDGFFIPCATIGYARKNTKSPVLINFFGIWENAQFLKTEDAAILQKLSKKVVTSRWEMKIGDLISLATNSKQDWQTIVKECTEKSLCSRKSIQSSKTQAHRVYTKLTIIGRVNSKEKRN